MKTKLLEFPKAPKVEPIPIEAGLQRAFWANVEKDLGRMLEAFLVENAGYTQSSEQFSKNMIVLRDEQGRTPSLYAPSLEQAYKTALHSTAESVDDLFLQERAKLRAKRVKPNHLNYIDAVHQAVVNDTSEVLSLAQSTWFDGETGRKAIINLGRKNNKDEVRDLLVEILKEKMEYDGSFLRRRLEERLMLRLSDHYVAPNFTPKIVTEILKFPKAHL